MVCGDGVGMVWMVGDVGPASQRLDNQSLAACAPAAAQILLSGSSVQLSALIV